MGALKILKDLETAHDVANPTQYVIKAAINAGGIGPPPGFGGPSNPRRQSGLYGDDAKQISTSIGQLNRRGIPSDRVSYSDVKDSLEAVGVDAALSILRDLERSSHFVKNP